MKDNASLRVLDETIAHRGNEHGKYHIYKVLETAMRRQMSNAPNLIKALAALSLIFIFAQLALIACKCRCRSDDCNNEASSLCRNKNDGKVMRGLDGISDETKFEDFEKVKLKEEIKALKKTLVSYKKISSVLVSQDLNSHPIKFDDNSDILRSFTPKNEYHVIPFDGFDGERLYGKVGTLSENPVEGPVGQRGIEHNEVIQFAIKTINDDSESKGDPVTTFQLAEGIMRNDRTHGTAYDLYFRSALPDIFKRIQVFRPFGPLQSYGKMETIDTSKSLINVIVPLSGRIDKFQEFINRFLNVGVRYDRKVFLTVVYFGTKDRDKLRSIIRQLDEQENFKGFKLIFTDQEFSRGAGLQKGAEVWEGGNVLMFFCDVDIYFNPEFLERCRLHSSPGEKVYYPIVFSQYNPVITYGGEAAPQLTQQMRISKDTGFWRDFGFGMSCQYRDDFFNVGGFDLTIKGWGMEDVKLYRSYLASKLTVVRAYDRGIFHSYHKKKCQRNLSDEQFVSCLQSKAVSEGSHKQMGMLAFGKHIVGETDPPWEKLLQFSLTAASAPQELTSEQEKVIENSYKQKYKVDTKGARINGNITTGLKGFGESLLEASKELRAILDGLSKVTWDLNVTKEIHRMKELQLLIVQNSQGILGLTGSD